MIREFEKVLKDANNELKKNREFTFSSLEKSYDGLNRSELIIVTGAFAILINFFIGRNNLECTYLLKTGIILLTFVIVLKSYLTRRVAGKKELEIKLIDKRICLYTDLIGVAVKLQWQNELNDAEKEKILNYHKEDKLIKDEFDNLKNELINGEFLNWIEFIAYVFGILLILIFFLINMK